MTINYGRPADPEDFIIGKLIPLGLPVGPEREELDSLPGYVVTSIDPKHDRHLLSALVSVQTFATATTSAMGRSAASKAAWDADDLLISQTPGDVITMADGRPASGWICPVMSPAYKNYMDPQIKRYVARYEVLLRFTPTN